MIGYYAHHQGHGHVARALSVAAATAEPVTVLSSAPRSVRGQVEWISLPIDTGPTSSAADPTAGGALHWAPLGHEGLSERMARIADWLAMARPRVLIVDVSVEVATLARLCGIPVVVVALPGRRTDSAHTLCFRLASRILVPWPREIYAPDWLEPHMDKVRFVGAWSRFDHLSRHPPLPGRVTVLCGDGGSTLTDDQVVRWRRERPELQWTVCGGRFGAADELWRCLCEATVVVTHAGQSALAEVAAARRPAIVVPEPRPFDEQLITAQALSRAGIADLAESWASVSSLLDHAPDGGTKWSVWHSVSALSRTFEVLDEAAMGAEYA